MGDMEVNEFKPPDSLMASRIQSAAGNPVSTCQTHVKESVSRCVKIPTSRQLHKRNGKGETILHKACKREDVAQVKALIQAGIRVNMEDYAGWTALHEASSVGNKAVVEELLKAGADVNSRSFDGTTPLHDAVISEHYEVIKLLLQCGSSTNDRNFGGLSALDMAEEGKIKQLLLTFEASSVIHGPPCEVPVQCSQPGGKFLETHCNMQLSCQGSFNRICSDKANVQSKESSERDKATEPSNIKWRKKDTTTDNLCWSEAIAVVLREVRRRQTDIFTWPLSDPKDAGTYHAALTQIQCVLIEVLTKQSLEKNNVTQRFWSASDSHCEVKRLISLASCQKSLVEILKKQMDLLQLYATMTSKLFTQSTSHQGSTEMRQQPEAFSAPSSANPQPGYTTEHKNPLTQTQAEHKSRHLFKLTQRGVLPLGSALHLLLKVTFRDKPLSYYLTMEADENTPKTCIGDNIRHCRAASFSNLLNTEAASQGYVMKIKVIRLVDDEGLVPNAILDSVWEKLLNAKLEEWWSELL